GGVIRPIGVSPRLVELPHGGGWGGNKWPPSDLGGDWDNGSFRTIFPDGAWSPYYRSLAVLGQFVGLELQEPPCRWDKIELPPIPSGEYIKKELAQLMQLIEYRPGVMAEALAQRQNIEIYFQGLLAYNGASHPNTYRLVEIAQRVGQFQAMYYKWGYQRPRPGQLCPALMPPIDVPGHAAYPSGHATGAYLIASCLREVMPKVA